MLPVYRVRDGWESLSNNKAIFKTCSQLLHQNNATALFPEASHNIKRQVRTLSKGFTRIIAETQNGYPEIDIQIVPVGFNYRRPEDFGDQVVLNFGLPLSSRKYTALNTNGAIIRLKQDVFNALTTLTTHIDGEDYDATIEKLEELNMDFLDPEAVSQCVSSGFENCRIEPKKKHNPVKAIAKIGLCMSLFLPYAIWKFILEPKIKEPEFTATFRFSLVISLVPIFMIVVAVILGLNFGILYAILYLASVLILDLIAVEL